MDNDLGLMGRSVGITRKGDLYKGSPSKSVHIFEHLARRPSPTASNPAKSPDSNPTKRPSSLGANAQGSKQRVHSNFSHSARFHEVVKDKLPGPGSYHKEGSWLWTSDSLSKKGYGAGFVSQDPRLKSRFRYTGPGPGRKRPGLYSALTQFKF